MATFETVSLLKQRLRKLYWYYHSRKRYAARQAAFQYSRTYWEQRYQEGGNSGSGSYGKFMRFKADVLNRFVQQHEIRSVIELGCGDGNQLIDMAYPMYLGFDVSPKAISICKNLFKNDKTKNIKILDEYNSETADLSLSLDVIYHLVEDNVFEDHMRLLFRASERYVIIYSSNENITRKNQGRHVRHRKFTEWIENNVKDWRLLEKIENQHPYTGVAGEGSYADFHIYEKMADGPCSTPSIQSRQH